MSEAVARAMEMLEKQVELEDPPGAWFEVKQEQINAFADATLDHNYIHCDPERCAAESPFETPIAHGFLTLSLVPHLIDLIPPPDPNPYEEVKLRINYGLDRVRFVGPVAVNSRIRARRKLLSVQKKGRVAVNATYGVTVDVEGQERPACLAEWILRSVFDTNIPRRASS